MKKTSASMAKAPHSANGMPGALALCIIALSGCASEEPTHQRSKSGEVTASQDPDLSSADATNQGPRGVSSSQSGLEGALGNQGKPNTAEGENPQTPGQQNTVNAGGGAPIVTMGGTGSAVTPGGTGSGAPIVLDPLGQQATGGTTAATGSMQQSNPTDTSGTTGSAAAEESVTTACQIWLTSCPLQPQGAVTFANWFNDTYDNANSNRARCLLRANDYASLCGLGASATVIARYLNNGQETERASATGTGAGTSLTTVPIYQLQHADGTDYLYSRSSAEGVDFGFRLEGEAFQLYRDAGAHGSVPLFRCLVGGALHMLSRDPNCEGTTVEGPIGHILPKPAAEAREIFRCRHPQIGKYLATADPSVCPVNGFVIEEPLGFAPR